MKEKKIFRGLLALGHYTMALINLPHNLEQKNFCVNSLQIYLGCRADSIFLDFFIIIFRWLEGDGTQNSGQSAICLRWVEG